MRFVKTLLALCVFVALCDAAQFVAVLETMGGSQAGLSKQECQYLTDELRSQALKALPPGLGYTVMTRENIQAMLPPDKTLEECQGDCLVTTGRNISADYVAQARVAQVGKRLAITVELYETKGAKLLGSFTDRSADIDGLIDVALKQAPGLFARIRGGQVLPAGSGSRAEAELSGDEVGTVVSFEFSEGAGVVLVDGKVACASKAKCGQELATGSHAVSASRDGYRDTSFTITVPKGNNRYTLRLSLQAGVLTVRAQDSESGDAVAADLYVDGLKVGATPWSGPVAVAAQNIELRAEGYESAVVTERPEAGKKRTVQAQLKAVSQVPPGMVAIKAGCFDMGSTDGEADEKPVHRVCLSAFYMDQTEVTNAQFRRSQGRNPHESDGSCWVYNGRKWEQGNLAAKFQGDKQPAVCVDWNQAQAYCASQGKRLPTEAESEYATRAGTRSKYFWGDDPDQGCRYANGADQTPLENGSSWNKKMECRDGYGDVTAPVGSFVANPWGLHDLAGNVWEWTNDWYGKEYYAGSPSQDPRGASSGSFRVYRGGSWYSGAAGLRSANRSNGAPGARNADLGFRCVSR